MEKILALRNLSDDPQTIDKRLRQRPNLGEAIGLTVAILFPVAVMLFSRVNLGGAQAYDFQHYLNTARGDFSFYYYAHWLLPLWQVLDLMPLWLAYLLWTFGSTLAIFFAGRVFGANTILLLLSYQTLIILYMGQFTGFVVAGLALLWWGLTHKKWEIAGVGLFLAASKYHTGLIPALTLLLCIEIPNRQRLRVLILPACLAFLSLLMYPLWPLKVIESYRNNPANDWGSIALWQWVGPAALLVWIPPLILKLRWRERIFMLFAATPLGIPYFQEADLHILNILPIGWLPLIGNLGFLRPFIGYLADKLMVTIPLTIYFSTLVSGIIESVRKSARGHGKDPAPRF